MSVPDHRDSSRFDNIELFLGAQNGYYYYAMKNHSRQYCKVPLSTYLKEYNHNLGPHETTPSQRVSAGEKSGDLRQLCADTAEAAFNASFD